MLFYLYIYVKFIFNFPYLQYLYWLILIKPKNVGVQNGRGIRQTAPSTFSHKQVSVIVSCIKCTEFNIIHHYVLAIIPCGTVWDDYRAQYWLDWVI